MYGKTNEVKFKTKMQEISEDLELYKSSLIIDNINNSDQVIKDLYAGKVLNDIDKEEQLNLDTSKIKDIRKMLNSVGKEEEEYSIVYEGDLYYVARQNDDKRKKWCEDIGIRVWEFTPPTGVEVIDGKYELVNGVYMCTPQLNSGFDKNKTRYINSTAKKVSGTNVSSNVGKWINNRADSSWYDYKNQKWANIYVEDKGVGTFFVWIPRYVYKTTPTGQRIDAKFVDTDNNYTDPDGNVTKWDDLKAQGYKLPEAFWWDNNSDKNQDDNEKLPGYWISKYELSEHVSHDVDYSLAAGTTSITVKDLKINDSIKNSVSLYTYALNGVIKHTSTKPENYTFSGLSKGSKVINVTALNSDGDIIGSMTQETSTLEMNDPDVTKFDPSTTFYVYWDDKGKEHNEIPVNKSAPNNWYDYSVGKWANIVTRNDGLETYYVWIPRYQYQVDSTAQRTNLRFIKGTSTDTIPNYKIPEAFWWDSNSNGKHDAGEELTGFWISKYQLNIEEKEMKFNAELTATNNSIRVQDITGTALSTTDASGNTTAVPLKYEYYLNGEKKGEGTKSNQHFVFTSLQENKEYTVNIIARNSSTDDFVAACTKKIKTILPLKPDVSKFDKDTTYYVIYNDDGTEKERKSIKEDMPNDWYDYSRQRWANIVTTANNTETYFVWIPRYEYKITKDRGALSLTNRRLDVRFITKDITNDNCDNGYEVPEAFWWDNNSDGNRTADEELDGYWISKYQLN